MPLLQANAAISRHIRFCWWVFGVLTAVALVWMLGDLPGRERVATGISLAGPLAACLLALPLFLTANARRAAAETGQRAPKAFWLWIVLAHVLCLAGESMFQYFEVIAEEPPFPSIADYAYSLSYPCWLLAVLSLVAGRVSVTLRSRYAIDSLMTTLAVGVFSWYFVVGPQVAATDGEASLIAQVLSVAYPVADLVLLFCLLLLSSHLTDARSRQIIRPLGWGLVYLLMADTVFGYQQLQGTYEAGRLGDLLWPIAYVLIGLAARTHLLLPASPAWERGDVVVASTPLWRAMLPYSLMPLVACLVAYAYAKPSTPLIDVGTFVFAALLVAAIVLRQVLSMSEHARLMQALQLSHDTLQQGENRFRIACQSTGDMIYDWNIATGQVQMFTSQTMDAMHSGIAEWELRIHADDRHRVVNAIQTHLEQGVPFNCEYRFRGLSGQEMYILDRGMTIRDLAGKPIRMIGAMTDLTAIKRTEAELKYARAYADEANQAKSLFLANMSHEIRTPMTAILGYADLMLDPKQTPSDRVDNLQRLRRSGQHLLTLINDILDLSKIEAGKMTVERLACSPCKVIAEVTSMLRGRAIEKGLKLQVEFDGPIPETINTDPTRLRQILMNLIGNAIKFTSEGHVKVVVRNEPSMDRMQFSVLDSGIGMTELQKQRLFEPFAQADSSTTRRFGGTGLGLTISQRLAQMLGGVIDVSSTPGVGSNFTLSLDTGSLEGVAMVPDPHEIVAAEPSETDALTPRGLTGRVLVAEDGYDNQRIIRAFLEMEGLSVDIAENGRIAMERALAEKAAGTPFDLVLMDMQMPEMDGYAATSSLRSKGYVGPIVALTAHAMETDREKCIKAGCDDFATKPIDREGLIDMVAKYIAPAELHIEPEPLFSPFAGHPALGDLVNEFVAALPARLTAITAAVTASELATAAKLAHQLKGSAGSYGFAPISLAAKTMEHAAKAELDSFSMRHALDQLSAVCRRARAGLPLAA